MSQYTHRAEELANEYGIDYSVDQVFDNSEYYTRLAEEGNLDREHMGWMEFCYAVMNLPHNSRNKDWGYGQHITSNVSVSIQNAGGLENTRGYEHLCVYYLHNAGFYLTSGWGNDRM